MLIRKMGVFHVSTINFLKYIAGKIFMYFYLAKYVALKNDEAIVEDSQYLIPSEIQLTIENAREKIYSFLSVNHSTAINVLVQHFETITEEQYTDLIQ